MPRLTLGTASVHLFNPGVLTLVTDVSEFVSETSDFVRATSKFVKETSDFVTETSDERQMSRDCYVSSTSSLRPPPRYAY